ncbi:hypothetical protein DPM19_02885 [Actinomadura craniellae]|uniref:Major facilitator superfamily (MFS) profile domain-containing protein n=1 Tax=Actinomadura craniellae TaxID=2231787 RepID=A0A365HDB4_9ACTN|nr:hypothetical protein [Actinomadura craniellae]RAY17120.1 hypothetical protein DPM19_02885 [Actinomadura craniellae]
MSGSPSSGKAAAALLGFLVGGAAGFLLTEAVAVFFAFALDRVLDVEHNGALLAVFAGVPVLCAVLGAAIGAYRAGRRPPT